MLTSQQVQDALRQDESSFEPRVVVGSGPYASNESIDDVVGLILVAPGKGHFLERFNNAWIVLAVGVIQDHLHLGGQTYGTECGLRASPTSRAIEQVAINIESPAIWSSNDAATVTGD